MIRLLLLLAFISSPVCGQESRTSGTSATTSFRLLEADRLAIEGGKVEVYRNPYMLEYTNDKGEDGGKEQWRYSAHALFDLTLAEYNQFRLFWNNRAYTYGTNSQVRHVGWYWELGTTIWPGKLDVFHRHHSEHCMECEGTDKRGYPLLDEYVVRMTFYERGK